MDASGDLIAEANTKPERGSGNKSKTEITYSEKKKKKEPPVVQHLFYNFQPTEIGKDRPTVWSQNDEYTLHKHTPGNRVELRVESATGSVMSLLY